MKLHVKATEEAIARTAISLNNSSFEGNRLWGGSINGECEEEEDKLGSRSGLGLLEAGFGRFLVIEDINRRGFFSFFPMDGERERERGWGLDYYNNINF